MKRVEIEFVGKLAREEKRRRRPIVEAVRRDSRERELPLVSILNEIYGESPKDPKVTRRPPNAVVGRLREGEMGASRSGRTGSDAGVGSDDRRQDPNRRPVKHGG